LEFVLLALLATVASVLVSFYTPSSPSSLIYLLTIQYLVPPSPPSVPETVMGLCRKSYISLLGHANSSTFFPFASNRKKGHSSEASLLLKPQIDDQAHLIPSSFKPKALFIRPIHQGNANSPDSHPIRHLKETIVEAVSKAHMVEPPEMSRQEPLIATDEVEAERGAGGQHRHQSLFLGTLGQVRKGLADANLEAVPYEESFFPNAQRIGALFLSDSTNSDESRELALWG